MRTTPPTQAALSHTSGTVPSTAFATALESARDYATASRSEATWRAYDHDWTCFATWCDAVEQTALPASAATIGAFLAAQANAGLAPSTLTRRLAAIRVVHEGNQHASAHDSPAVRAVMRGIRKRNKKRKKIKKAPLVATDLAALVDTLALETLAGCRDRALLLIGFAAALRRSELVAIDVEHLAFRPEGLVLTIPYAKTDQEGEGAMIKVPALAHSRHCPVTALKQWLSVSGITEGAVFRRLRRGPSIGKERLSDGSVAQLIKHYARVAGYSKKEVAQLAGHSLRRGFLTTAARQREDILAIAAQSRHRSLESVREYTDEVAGFDNHPGLRMFP